MCGGGRDSYQSVFHHFDEIPEIIKLKEQKFIWVHRVKNLGAGTAGQLSG